MRKLRSFLIALALHAVADRLAVKDADVYRATIVG
jgi:hypothetical protein